MRSIRRIAGTTLVTGALALGVLATATPAVAKDGDVIRRGACSARSDWKLKLSEEDGRLEVEFEVDENVNGRTWDVTLKRNGAQVFAGSRTTRAPSGSFELRRVISDPAGVDNVVARAVSRATGEVCRGNAASNF